MSTQNDAILALLRERGDHGLTPIEALHLVGSFRLGARIYELRQAGYDIESGWYETENGSRVARYVLRERRPVLAGEQIGLPL